MRNYIKIILILLTIGVTNIHNSFSQDTIDYELLENDLSIFILPPIDTLFNYLEKNPIIKTHDYRILEQESMIKTKKRDWINYFRFSSSYQYGYQGAEYIVQGFQIPAFYQTSQNAQNLYHIGISISIPIGDLIDNGNKIKKEKYRLNQLITEKDISLNEQKFMIIELYNLANEKLVTYKKISEIKKYSELKSSINQNDFINGIITIDQLTEAKKSESDVISNFEKIKSELLIALMKLEIICNYKFEIIKHL